LSFTVGCEIGEAVTLVQPSLDDLRHQEFPGHHEL